MCRITSVVLSTLLFLSAVVAFQSQPAEAATTFSLQSDLRNHYEVSSGQVIEDTIRVQNPTDSEVVINLKKQDYKTTPDYSHFEEPGTYERSNSSWITVNPKRLELGPREKGTFSYRIRVPEGDKEGTYWSALMLEPSSPVEKDPDGGFAVNQVVRYAVTVSCSFGSSGLANLKLSDINLEPFYRQKGEAPPYVQATIKNKGNRVAFFNPVLTLYSTNGEQIAQYEMEDKRLFPGSGVELFRPIKQIPPGEYQAMMLLDTGIDESTAGARFRFTIEDPTQEELKDMIPTGGEKTLVTKKGATPEVKEGSIQLASDGGTATEDESGSSQSDDEEQSPDEEQKAEEGGEGEET